MVKILFEKTTFPDMECFKMKSMKQFSCKNRSKEKNTTLSCSSKSNLKTFPV